MLRCYQTGKDVNPASRNREVVIATPESLPAVLYDPQAAAFGAVIRRQFLQPDDSVGDAVDRLVRRVRRKVVEHQDRSGVPREEVLESQDLTAVPERPWASSRISERLSSTILDGLMRSTASKIIRVVSPSSRSEE